MIGDDLWQDREAKFDINPSLLNLVPGEKAIIEFASVEDSKGNSGELGCAIISTLRLIWHSHRLPKINISLGFNCIISINSNQVQTKVRGTVDSLIVLAKCAGEMYEFLFTNLSSSGPSMFTSLNSIHRSYVSTKMYRELKLRGSLLKDDVLKTFPHEEIFREVHGVLNLSNDQGNIGVLIVTNLRVVWYATSNHIYNVSIPYLQIKDMRVRDSKFGTAIVFEITKLGGGYLLGFRIDPTEKLNDVFKEMKKLHKMYMHNPDFGVECLIEDKLSEVNQTPKFSEDIEVDSTNENHTDVFAIYCADGQRSSNREPVYNEDMGLLFEKLPEGYSLSDLWDVMK